MVTTCQTLSFAAALDLIARPSKRPALQVPCEECGGHGQFAEGNPMNPDARFYDCEHCCGEGVVDAHCQVCGGDEPAVEAILGPYYERAGDDPALRATRGPERTWLACEACVKDEERAAVIDFEIHHEVDMRQILLEYSGALNAATLAATKLVGKEST
jgi:hypothetical protein